jgi:hypothetical protein
MVQLSLLFTLLLSFFFCVLFGRVSLLFLFTDIMSDLKHLQPYYLVIPQLLRLTEIISMEKFSVLM